MALKKRPVSTEPKPGTAGEWIDQVFQRDYPNLYAFLHDVKYDDGTIRITGSMSIFVKVGGLRCSLNDKDRNVVAYIEASSFDEMMTLAEEGICSDSTEWIASRKTPPY